MQSAETSRRRGERNRMEDVRFGHFCIRFDEKCRTEEESVCRTVYDTVLEHKCEVVNITVPQRECEQVDTMEPGEQCRVETREVTKPACVTMMDKVVEEVM